MIKSMTGFGRGEYSDDTYTFNVEIKTVNHRYNDNNKDAKTVDLFRGKYKKIY